MANGRSKDVSVEVKASGSQRSKSRSRSRSRGRTPAVKVTVNSKAKRFTRRPSRRSFRAKNNSVKQQVRNQLKKQGLTGPAPAVVQTATATLGTIGPNTGNDAEREISFYLNPALTKENTGSNAFGPVQALAAQYSMWRCSRAEIRFTPLIGPSAISGTAYRCSLNMAGTPSQTSWSGLGSRKHKDMHIGKSGSFKLTKKELSGPKETWWLTNTNEEGGQTLGPAVEIHSIGKTVRVFTSQTGQTYDGPVFLVELRATWEFANFSANPGLVALEKGEDTARINFSGNIGEPLVMKVTGSSDFHARMMRVMGDDATYTRTGEIKASEVIVQVVDAGTDIISSTVPGFGWLIKAGWFFIKKLAGLSRNGDGEYAVYASYADAQNNRPCILPSTVTDVTPKPTTLAWQQMNKPNLGLETGSYAMSRSMPVPVEGSYKAILQLDNYAQMIHQLQADYPRPALAPYWQSLELWVGKGNDYGGGQHADRITQVYKVNRGVFLNQFYDQVMQPEPTLGYSIFSNTSHGKIGEVLGFQSYHMPGPTESGAESLGPVAFNVYLGRITLSSKWSVQYKDTAYFPRASDEWGKSAAVMMKDWYGLGPPKPSYTTDGNGVVKPPRFDPDDMVLLISWVRFSEGRNTDLPVDKWCNTAMDYTYNVTVSGRKLARDGQVRVPAGVPYWYYQDVQTINGSDPVVQNRESIFEFETEVPVQRSALLSLKKSAPSRAVKYDEEEEVYYTTLPKQGPPTAPWRMVEDDDHDSDSSYWDNDMSDDDFESSEEEELQDVDVDVLANTLENSGFTRKEARAYAQAARDAVLKDGPTAKTVKFSDAPQE
ncbi:capsid protein [Bottlenose dolphin astrovirus 1]|uniref:Capsid protein n=1 Tax=Mamastrovirus 7 TaxID=1239571 RepID=C5IDQ0_9VIRU|nr:capsid protein [Bottlenose dolphin astrovirus 1]ACR54280.1 capsid protein [Bottlenose dolphin astrovirus 1]